jgi:hypothetical protein
MKKTLNSGRISTKRPEEKARFLILENEKGESGKREKELGCGLRSNQCGQELHSRISLKFFLFTISTTNICAY